MVPGTENSAPLYGTVLRKIYPEIVKIANSEHPIRVVKNDFSEPPQILTNSSQTKCISKTCRHCHKLLGSENSAHLYGTVLLKIYPKIVKIVNSDHRIGLDRNGISELPQAITIDKQT